MFRVGSWPQLAPGPLQIANVRRPQSVQIGIARRPQSVQIAIVRRPHRGPTLGSTLGTKICKSPKLGSPTGAPPFEIRRPQSARAGVRISPGYTRDPQICPGLHIYAECWLRTVDRFNPADLDAEPTWVESGLASGAPAREAVRRLGKSLSETMRTSCRDAQSSVCSVSSCSPRLPSVSRLRPPGRATSLATCVYSVARAMRCHGCLARFRVRASGLWPPTRATPHKV